MSRIANNTILLYVRMIILMVINLYTTRIILRVLGIEDFGIFSSVAGIITMLSCINTVMSNTTQRFYSLYIGKKDYSGLKQVFSVSLDVYIILIAIAVIIGESLGLWFVNSKLIIPIDRICAANWVYQFSIFTFISTVIPMPYLAAIIAHENMAIFSLFTTIEYIIKLGFALLLTVITGDTLILYAISLFVAQTLLMLSYIIYGRIKYNECHYQPFKRNGLHRQVLSYSSWMLFGSLAGIGMNQIMTILYNIFFGPIVTASRAISLQLNAALTSFSNSFIMAIRPPMIKRYSENRHDYLMKLFNIGNKFIYYSILMISIPLILEMDWILKIWLSVEDKMTIRFSQYIVIYFVILSLNNPISIIIQAIGKVKDYHLRVEVFTFLCPAITYLLFKFGCSATYGYYVMIITIALSHIVRLYCLKKYYPIFKYKDYLIHFVFSAVLVTVLVTLISYVLHCNISSPIIRVIVVSIASIFVSIICSYYLGLSKLEKSDVRGLIKSVIKKTIK